MILKTGAAMKFRHAYFDQEQRRERYNTTRREARAASKAAASVVPDAVVDQAQPRMVGSQASGNPITQQAGNMAPASSPYAGQQGGGYGGGARPVIASTPETGPKGR
jgi:hypothetical protein